MGGSCECEKNPLSINELKNYFNRNKEISEEETEIINKQKNKKRIIIKKFIIKNISRLYYKEKFINLKAKAQNLFFEKEELNFKYDKIYFEKKVNKELNKFFKQKENIIKDLFPQNLIGSLHSFPKLRDKISTYHNNNILNNQKEYLNDLLSFLTENNLIKSKITNPNTLKQLLAKIALKEALNNGKEKNKFFRNNI